MKITIDIGANDYTFEMNRAMYKRLLADEEYAEVQNELTKRIKNKTTKGKKAEELGEEIFADDISEMLLSNLVMEEQIFYYSLLTHQPQITKSVASALIDVAYEEYGREEVSALTTKLMENFTQRGDEPKKKMTMRIS
jgi:translation elongation factor EF-G